MHNQERKEKRATKYSFVLLLKAEFRWAVGVIVPLSYWGSMGAFRQRRLARALAVRGAGLRARGMTLEFGGAIKLGLGAIQSVNLLIQFT